LLDEHHKLGALTVDLVTRIEARTPILALVSWVIDFHVLAWQRAFTQVATTTTVALPLLRRLTAIFRRRLDGFIEQRVELALQRLLVFEQVGKSQLRLIGVQALRLVAVEPSQQDLVLFTQRRERLPKLGDRRGRLQTQLRHLCLQRRHHRRYVTRCCGGGVREIAHTVFMTNGETSASEK